MKCLLATMMQGGLTARRKGETKNNYAACR